MAAIDDPKTLGRARLSFATEADVDEFVRDPRPVRAGRTRSRPMAHVPPAARHLRAAAGRRPDDPRQDPAGDLMDAQLARARRRRRALVARLRPHHDAAEHAVPLRAAARRRAVDAPPGRRRPDDARGVRQLGPQHHGLPLRRRPRRRGVRRDAVRRGADPLLPAASAELASCRASSRSRFEGCAAITLAAINDIGWRRADRTASAASASPSAAARRR